MGAFRRPPVLVLAAACALAAVPASARGRSPAGQGVARLAVELARPLPQPIAEAVATAITEELSSQGIPGLSVALGDIGELRFAAGYGLADVENEVAASPQTAYRLASVSKPMTAVAALQLAEKGLLDLDAPIGRHCEAFPQKAWTLTARQLLCHQGGVRGYRPNEPPQTRRYESVTAGLEVFKDDPLAYEPGTATVYTTYGYCLLGCAIEGASGRPFAEVLRDEVFAKAGMTATRPDDLRTLVPHRAAGYYRTPTGELVNSNLADTSYKVPGGGLCGTAPDVARFGLALLSGRLVGRSSLQLMLTGQPTRYGRPTGFGLGLAVGRRRGQREAWHVGGQERVSTILYLRPDSSLAIALLANLEKAQTPLLDLARRLADLLTADKVIR